MATLPATPPARRILTAGLPFLLLAALVPYVPLLGGELVGDGRALVTGHETLRTATRSPEKFARLFAEEYWDGLALPSGLYRPFTTGLLALVHGIAGESPLPYRILSILLHGAVVLAAFSLARRLLPPSRAALAAALFALHPVHSESVGDVANVGEMLSALLSFALLARILGREGAGGAGALAADGGLMLAALLAKESAASALLVAALAAALLPSPAGHRRPRPWIVLLPLAAALLFDLLARTLAVGFLYPRYLPTNRIENPLIFEPSSVRVATASRVLVHALGLLVLPLRLSADYSLETFPLSRSPLEPAALASFLALLGIVRGATLLRRRNPVACFSLLASLASFAPTSNLLFPAGTILAERHLLVPSFYAAVALVALAPRLGGRAAKAARAALAALLVLLAVRTFARALEWRTARELTEVTARRDSPRSVRLLFNLAAERRKAGDLAGSKEALERALAIHPDFYQARTRLGLDLVATGGLEEGTACLARALRESLASYPSTSPLWDEAASTYTDTLARRLGRGGEAIAYWRSILHQFPGYPDARIELAHALDLGGVEGAEGELREASRERAGARLLLAQRLSLENRTQEALEVLRAPLPPGTRGNAAAQVSFAEGQTFLGMGRREEAAEAFRRTWTLASAFPIRAAARAGLALARLEVDRTPEGVRAALAEAEAAAADPGLPQPLREQVLRIVEETRARTLGR